MKFNPGIFKSYDIRGIYPSELDEGAAYLIGRALARKSGAKIITVGSDMRLSGPALKKALINGITDEGVNVKDIGLVPIDAVYFCVGGLGDEGGVMITASHNPKEYNGFKMALKDMRWIRGVELLDDVKNLPELKAFKKGEIKEDNVIPQFIKHILSFVDLAKIKPFRVVVDAGNGMAGKIMPILAEHLPINMIPMNFELDGNFPAHPSNPLLPESQKGICEAVVRERADFGIILDGDTDRLFFIDEKGNFIPADLTLLLLAKVFLEKEPGAGIVYNAICSRVVPETIEKWGGRALKSKVGFINLMTIMREENGVMAGELSAHYSFRDNFYADSGFIAFLVLLQLLSGQLQPLSEIVKPFYKYFKSPEMNFEVADKDKVMEKIKQKYSSGKLDFLDGVTVDYQDWWFNVRPSNTEPLLRVTIEAEKENLLKEKQREISELINALKG